MKKLLTAMLLSASLFLGSLTLGVIPASAAWYYAGLKSNIPTWCWENSSSNCYQEKKGAWYPAGPNNYMCRHTYRRNGSIGAYPSTNFYASTAWVIYGSPQCAYFY